MRTCGSEAEYQPGSRGRVLRNLLGITRVQHDGGGRTQALIAAQRAARKSTDPTHRFTSADIRRLHRMWLGSIYPWAGNYRNSEHRQGRLAFAHAPLIPRFMANFGKGNAAPTYALWNAADATVARSLAEVHAQLILIHPFRDGNGRLARLVVSPDGSSGRSELAEIERVGRSGKRSMPGYPRCDDARLRPLESAFCVRARRSLATSCWQDVPTGRPA